MTAGLPTLTKTWLLSANNTVAASGTLATTNKTLLKAWVASLIGMSGSSWVCYSSCNASVAGTANDGVNRWSSASDITGNSAGNAHSWMVIKNTATGVSICIDVNGTGAATQISLYVSPAGLFSTGGTTTNRPTASDEWTWASSATWGLNTSSDVQYRYHIWQSSDGQCTRLMIASAGTPQSIFFLGEKFAAAVQNFIYPYYFNLVVNTTLSYANLYNVGKFRLGSVTGATEILIPGNTAGPGNSNATYGTVANSADSSWTFWPATLAGTTASALGHMGAFYDLWFGSTSVALADRYPLDTDTPPGQFIQLGAGGPIFRWLDSTTALGLT